MPALHGRFIHDGPLSTAQCPNFVPGASIFGFPSVDTSTLHRTLARKTAPVVDILAPNATSAFVSVALNMPSAVLSGICTWPVCITNSARPAMADVCTWSSFAADAAALLLIFVPCLYFWQVGTQCVGGYHDVSYHTEERCFGGVPKPEDRKNAPCHGEMKKPRNTSMFSAECKMCMNMCVCVCASMCACLCVCVRGFVCVCLYAQSHIQTAFPLRGPSSRSRHDAFPTIEGSQQTRSTQCLSIFAQNLDIRAAHNRVCFLCARGHGRRSIEGTKS